MALLQVLWVVGLMAVIAGSFLSASTVSYRLARHAVQVAKTETAAEAAVARAVLGLVDPEASRRWRVDGVPQGFVWDGTPLRIAIQDALGRIDLNHTDGETLTRLFQSAGLGSPAAAALADKVLDWRDPSPAKRVGGAKAADYRAAGLAYGPRNGPFQSVAELKLVLGMTPALFDRVAPALTVASQRPRIDPRFAPPEALRALPNMTEARLAALMAAREKATTPGILNPAIPLGGRAFALRVEIDRDGRSLNREAVIRLTDDPRDPYWLLAWGRR